MNIYKRKVAYVAFAAILLMMALCAFSAPSAAYAASDVNVRVVTSGSDDIFLEWDAVSGADSYRITSVLSGESVSYDVSSSATVLRLNGLLTRGGEYTFSVAALCDGEILASGSVIYEYFVALPSPSGFVFSDGEASWLPVNYATGYAVAVNGIALGTVTDCRFDLSGLLMTSGEYVFSVTAVGDEYNSDSKTASFVFSFVAAPPPPYDILLCLNGYSYIASWTPRTDILPDGYVYRVDFESSTLVCATTVNNFADLTAYVSADGTYSVYVACIKDGVTGEFFSRDFAVENGVPML